MVATTRANTRRNNAAAPAPAPAPPAPAAQAPAAAQGSDTEASVASSRESQGGHIPVSMKKQLAEDIEANGGIEHFRGASNQNLCQLLNRDPDTYGRRGDTVRRRKFTNKVSYWLRLSLEGHYNDRILNRFGVTSHRNRRLAARNQSAAVQESQEEEQEEEFLSSSDDSSLARAT